MVNLAPTCPSCGGRDGEYHVPGCPAEECPVCGRAVISCHCRALSPVDMGMILNNLRVDLLYEDALRVEVPRSTKLPWSLVERAGHHHIMQEAMTEVYAPYLYTDGRGQAVFDGPQISRGFSIPREEAEILISCEFMRAPSASGFWQ